MSVPEIGDMIETGCKYVGTNPDSLLSKMTVASAEASCAAPQGLTGKFNSCVPSSSTETARDLDNRLAPTVANTQKFVLV